MSLTFEQVRQYWKDKAATMGADPHATIRDHEFRLLEMEHACRRLPTDGRLLDVGCGNGFSTRAYAARFDHVVGIDLIPGMVAAARRNPNGNRGLSWAVSDAARLPFPAGYFDAAVMSRCLINIPNRTTQAVAVSELARVLRPAGACVLTEVTLQGHARLNALRQKFGLPLLKTHWHNTYLDEDKFRPVLDRHFEIIEELRFGMYMLISKVLHPLLVAPEEPRFDSRINNLARQIASEYPDFEGASHQVMWILRKKPQ